MKIFHFLEPSLGLIYEFRSIPSSEFLFALAVKYYLGPWAKLCENLIVFECVHETAA